MEGDLLVNGRLNCNSITSPFWVAGNFNASGQIFSQKGRFAMTVRAVAGDESAFDINFPAHPDGNRYTLSFTSTEFHMLYRFQTSTYFRVYCRTNANAVGFQGSGFMSIMILA